MEPSTDCHILQNQPLDTLRSFVRTMADNERDLSTLEGPVLHYGLFLRKILNANRPEFLQQRDINAPTRISSGDALTPWHAAACMDDRTRTAAFVRGAIRAVDQTLKRTPDRPLHLVEAGCGPLGTLVLPLLAHFSEEELVVSLIDLHQESIDGVRAMLDHFGFLPRTRQLVCGDATAVSLDSAAHIVLTETMNTALSEEPQVAITRALLRENPHATLIPQSIRIELALLDLAAETSHFPPRPSDRMVVAPVFELNRRTALDLTEKDGVLPAATVTLPSHFPPQLVPCLTTTIQVFEEIRTSDYETQISQPLPLVREGQALPPGTRIQFFYRMGTSPGLVWHLPDEEHTLNDM